MITKFIVKNFKSIEKVKLDLKPLTILTGRNATGKSNILEAIAIIGQTARLPPEIIKSLQGSLSKGEYYQYPYPYTNFVAYKNDLNKVFYFEIHLEVDEDLTVAINSVQNSNSKFSKYIPRQFSSVGYAFSYQKTEDLQDVSQKILVDDTLLAEISLKKEGSGYKYIYKYPEEISGTLSGDVSQLFRPESFIRQPKSYPPSTLRFKDEFFDAVYFVIEKILHYFEKKIKRIFPISVIRGSIGYEASSMGKPSWVGKLGENLVPLLSLCSAGLNFKDKYDKITSWAEKFEIKGLTAGFWGEQRLRAEFLDPILLVPLNLSLASFGSKQILTIITQLFWSDPGDVILIEEPEISLHPGAQVLLQELFVDAINENKQIICTTHSPFLILALLKVIKSGKLSNKDIAIYHLEKTKHGTKAKHLHLNNRGYITGWIDSYAKVEDELFKEWSEGIGDD